jgi:hypothetical protein
VPPIALFAIFTLLLCGVFFVVWRYWNNIARVSPEEEEYDVRVAEMNERQANRLSDDQLRSPLSDDEAWAVMVHRGMRDRERGRRNRRDTKRLTPPRRERYGGELARRIDERRERLISDRERRAEERRDRDVRD